MEFLLRRMIMKRLVTVLIPALVVVAGAYATGKVVPPDGGDTMIDIVTDVDTKQIQNVSLIGGGNATSGSSSVATGGDSESNSNAVSSSGASIETTSVSNYETRTQPLSVFPSYLPYWTHGGWGTVKAYFPNGPNSDDQVYERLFNPSDPKDMKELKGVLQSLSYESPIHMLGGILNGVGVVFGGADNFHRGRGFEIANALVRTRRPKGKPLLVFIDSNVDRDLLKRAGYAYVGKVSLEGKVDRNWDQVYDAAVAESLPWDVDILLIAGGMKGVTVGSNISFPGASGGYSQVNHSVSLFGSISSGITEGKGKALVSAEGYRLSPTLVNRRRIPQSFYDRINATVKARPKPKQRIAQPRQEVSRSTGNKQFQGVQVSRELYDMAGFDNRQMVDYVTVR
jgi:hypothetical protein